MFVDALSSVRYAASSETMRQNLQIVDVRSPVGRQKDGRMRASDGGRYHQVRLVHWPKGLDLQIPIGAVDVLMKLLRATEIPSLDIAETDTQIVFRIGSDVFVASKLVVEFPNVDDRLLRPAMDNDLQLVVDRQALVQAIRRVRITSDVETSALALVLSPGKLSVRSKDKNGNTCIEELDASWTSTGERTVGFNHKHLSDLLSSIDAPVCEFYLGKDTKQKRSPLLLKDESSGTVGVLSQQRPDFVS
jgi:DNA polymerase-3 subunit beta